MTTATKAKPDEEETKGLGLNPTQVISGAGASVTSTVAGSTLGASGTLWGAAIGSVISTVAAALYAHSIKRGREKVTKVLPVGTPAGATAVPGRDDTKVLPAHLDPRADKPRRFDIKLDRKFWIKIAVFATGMFLAVMAVITGIELLTQKPVAALVGDTETSRSTTLGTVTDNSPSTAVPGDEQQEDSPVTTTDESPRPDDEGAEPTGTTEPEVTEDSEQEGGAEPTQTAESTSEGTAERTTEDSTEAPARTTAQPEPEPEADTEE